MSDKPTEPKPPMNIMKQAILVKAKAYSKRGNHEKARKRAAELRAEIDAASRNARK